MLNFWRKSKPEPTPQRPDRSPAEYEAVLRSLLEQVDGDDARIKMQVFNVTEII
jgi:hypothetical protein